jgi:hypothetical protein
MTRLPTLSVVFLLALVACRAPQPPPVITPGTVRAWQANQAVIALGDLQRAAINYHATHRCDDNGLNCVRMLSEANTRVVVSAIVPALERIKAEPSSWKPVGLGALNTIDQGLDAKGHERMDADLTKARSTLDGL